MLSTEVFSNPASFLGLTHSHMEQLNKDEAERKKKLDDALKMIEEAKQDALKRMKEESALHSKPAAAPAAGQPAGKKN